MRTPTPDELALALSAHARRDMPALPGRSNHLLTGVLVPLVWEPEPVCIATVRAFHLREHAGEVCFPGGRPDPTDEDLAQTAMREAAEELGIAGARILGELSSIPLYTSEYRLRPFVGAIASTSFVVNPVEVAAVLRMPIASWLSAPFIDAIPWEHEGEAHLSPVFEMEGGIMFGATAHVFHELLGIMAPLCESALPPMRAGRHTWEGVLGIHEE
jgi:8-oxo-dGTP pyrophosphatase MutT (NUDIX family)